MQETKQQSIARSTPDELKPPSKPINPNEPLTRKDITFNNVVEELLLPVISAPDVIKTIRGYLADSDPKVRNEKFRDLKTINQPETIKAANQLLDQLERKEKVAFNETSFDLLRAFYVIAFRPDSRPLMSPENQVELRKSIEACKLPPKQRHDWEGFCNFGPNNRPTIFGFIEGTLILHALAARCFSGETQTKAGGR